LFTALFTRAVSRTDMLACPLGERRDNERNSRSVFRLVYAKRVASRYAECGKNRYADFASEKRKADEGKRFTKMVRRKRYYTKTEVKCKTDFKE
ncbi:MAG: hypothetical protein U0L49_10750, partial [Eubacterium sp.]|nr:hypothetical protein [Eubacterium sp.]